MCGTNIGMKRMHISSQACGQLSVPAGRKSSSPTISRPEKNFVIAWANSFELMAPPTEEKTGWAYKKTDTAERNRKL